MSEANLNQGGDPASTVGTGGEQSSTFNQVDTKTDIDAELLKAEELEKNYKIRRDNAAKKLAVAQGYKTEAEMLEAQLKNKSNNGASSTPKKDDSGAFTREEAKIFTQIVNSGLPEELTDAALERVGKIAALEGISIAEAYKTDDFRVWRDRKVQTYKHEQAQLGASRGGSSTSQVKTFDTPGLTDAEHMALYKQKYGR